MYADYEKSRLPWFTDWESQLFDGTLILCQYTFCNFSKFDRFTHFNKNPIPPFWWDPMLLFLSSIINSLQFAFLVVLYDQLYHFFHWFATILGRISFAFPPHSNNYLWRVSFQKVHYCESCHHSFEVFLKNWINLERRAL